MRKTYLAIARTIAVLVVVQAALMVWAIVGLFSWIDEGASLDKSVIDSWETEPPTFSGAVGHFIHVMSGTFLFPLLGLALLVVAIFAKIPRGVVLASVVVLSIVVQYTSAALAEPDAPWLGLVHGTNAFILLGAALMAARAAQSTDRAGTEPSAVTA